MPCSLSMQPCSPVAAKLVAESLQSQINVQLCKNWDICCCSTCSTCSTCKKTLGKGKRHNAALQHWIKSVNNQAFARTIRPQWIKEGGSSVRLGHIKKHGLSHWGYQEWGRQILYYLISCVRSSTCTMRGSRTSNMVWFISLLLRALLLDELWTSTCLAKTITSCIKRIWNCVRETDSSYCLAYVLRAPCGMNNVLLPACLGNTAK